ncbi:HNH endonuclease [Acaryochloris thomasi]|uniref:HNH endonuclease n=1 Tax=Acaryochloris thomasi TaxID=2929456 RepID=UPI001F360EF2|nr:HNH endonuclease [Acaryochloris thomasi]
MQLKKAPAQPMSLERHRYPADWKAIATSIKEEAGWQCENCGKVCRRTGESLMDYIQRSQYPAVEVLLHRQRYTLDGAHLDQDPENNRRSNLKALCRVCHLNHDRKWSSSI